MPRHAAVVSPIRATARWFSRAARTPELRLRYACVGGGRDLRSRGVRMRVDGRGGGQPDDGWRGGGARGRGPLVVSGSGRHGGRRGRRRERRRVRPQPACMRRLPVRDGRGGLRRHHRLRDVREQLVLDAGRWRTRNVRLRAELRGQVSRRGRWVWRSVRRRWASGVHVPADHVLQRDHRHVLGVLEPGEQPAELLPEQLQQLGHPGHRQLASGARAARTGCGVAARPVPSASASAPSGAAIRGGWN